MATNLSSFLQQLADKAGVDQNDKALIDFLAHTELNRINISDDLAGTINKNLLSLDDAKNNHPVVKTHYFAEVMSNVDRALGKLYQKLELEQDDIDELARETSSTKRIALVGDKISEILQSKIAEASKGHPKANEQVQSLQAQVNDLNEKLRIEKEARSKEKGDFENNLSDFKKRTGLMQKVSALKTIYDDLPVEVRNTTLETLVNKELQDSGVQFILDENGNLKPQKKDGSNFFDENNRLVSADDLIQRTLAKHKILKQSAPAPPARSGEPAPATPGANNGQPARVDGGGQNGASTIAALINESLQSLETVNPTEVVAGK